MYAGILHQGHCGDLIDAAVGIEENLKMWVLQKKTKRGCGFSCKESRGNSVEGLRLKLGNSAILGEVERADDIILIRVK
ncbi:MAG: hypothetical protein COV29_00060 [Candidatus Yanofskybacteria bacterium CG10_big_fil_rev_8_21_14_0_10_36_16]|uniref:Uncharacterized protein n=1 Tax=Candidatus Yanofskybacteria bacterium CG10_big_fil_rev_8_21_14_0_10_36_16 TaxID=1975096 RepID=A0A2J0Q8F6_9BACT|nr:MAG: hypothetical protein COV29_00060 [Candidatus Yanofskybacteria bacterium CG10_big_fil_rev_8_21_14_0_10_36_16]